VPVTEADAAQRLDLEVRQRRELALREVAHALLGESDVGGQLRREGGGGGVRIGRLDHERLRRPAVELERPLAHRVVAAPLYVLEQLRDLPADVVVRRGGRDRRPLEVVGHGYAALALGASAAA
jgi:hypothetical protein